MGLQSLLESEFGSGPGCGSGSEPPSSQYCDLLNQNKLRLEYTLIAIAQAPPAGGQRGLPLHSFLPIYQSVSLMEICRLPSGLLYCWIPLGWIGVVFAAQVILCKILFIRSGGGKFVIITNKRIFHWFSYMLFIYNAVLGLLMAVVRLLLSTLFSLLLLVRMDRVVLMKGFEVWDLGHKAYVGFLYLEHTYNNAVVNMFVKLMMNVVWARQRVNIHYGNGDTSTVPLLNEDAELNSIQANVENDFCGPLLQGGAGKRRSYQARNRWLVAYTLLRNPSLQELTASRIEERTFVAHSDYINTTYGTASQSSEREAALAFYENSPKRSANGYSAAATANMTIN